MKRWEIEFEAKDKLRTARKYRRQEDYEAAMCLYDEVFVLYKLIDDRILQYDVFKDIGDTACEMENFSGARAYYKQARAVFKNKLPPERYIELLKCLKNVSVKERDFPRAYRELKEILRLFPEQRNVGLLEELGAMADQLGDTEASDNYFAQALALSDSKKTIELLKIWAQALSRREEQHLTCQWYRLAVLLSEQQAEAYSTSLYAEPPYSFITEASVDRAWNELEALHQELKAMGCDDCSP